MRKKRVTRWFAAYLLLRVIARSLKLLTTKEVFEINKEYLPRRGPVFMHTNHFTTAEEAGVILDRLSQGIHILYKADLETGKNPLTWVMGGLLVRPVLRLAGFIPTRREVKETTAVEKVCFVIERKGYILAMPERTSRHDTLIEGRGRGTARLAMQYNCVVLPIGVSGAKGAIVNGLLSYLRLGRKQKITIAYGRPLLLSQLGIDLQNDPTGEQATTEIMVRIGALLPKSLWGYYHERIEEFLNSEVFDVGHYREVQSRFFN
jgi:hypothetical protein